MNTSCTFYTDKNKMPNLSAYTELKPDTRFSPRIRASTKSVLLQSPQAQSLTIEGREISQIFKYEYNFIERSVNKLLGVAIIIVAVASVVGIAMFASPEFRAQLHHLLHGKEEYLVLTKIREPQGQINELKKPLDESPSAPLVVPHTSKKPKREQLSFNDAFNRPRRDDMVDAACYNSISNDEKEKLYNSGKLSEIRYNVRRFWYIVYPEAQPIDDNYDTIHAYQENRSELDIACDIWAFLKSQKSEQELLDCSYFNAPHIRRFMNKEGLIFNVDNSLWAYKSTGADCPSLLLDDSEEQIEEFRNSENVIVKSLRAFVEAKLISDFEFLGRGNQFIVTFQID